MSADFQGFPADGMTFLKNLTRNNNRDWFQANKKTFETAVKGPMVELVECLNGELAKFAPDYQAAPKKAISRMNRDTRFSQDKSPYRMDIAAVFPHQGKEKHEAAGFYFSVSASQVDVVGGVYMPGPEQLATLRGAIAERHQALRKLLAAKTLNSVMGELQGERLQRVPKGFDAEHLAGDLLRFKQLYFRRPLPGAVATTPRLLTELVSSFKAMTPFVKFLDDALAG